MGYPLPGSEQKIKTLIEYLKIQGHSDVADLLIGATITEEDDQNLMTALLDVANYNLYLNLPLAAFHKIQTDSQMKRQLEKFFLQVVPKHRDVRIFKIRFRMLPV